MPLPPRPSAAEQSLPRASSRLETECILKVDLQAGIAKSPANSCGRHETHLEPLSFAPCLCSRAIRLGIPLPRHTRSYAHRRRLGESVWEVRPARGRRLRRLPNDDVGCRSWGCRPTDGRSSATGREPTTKRQRPGAIGFLEPTASAACWAAAAPPHGFVPTAR